MLPACYFLTPIGRDLTRYQSKGRGLLDPRDPADFKHSIREEYFGYPRY